MKGAAAHFADHPLDRRYLFNTGDIASGELLRRVRAALENLDFHVDQQRYYRQRIRLEVSEFEQQTRAAFFEN
jgi:hypothetical protein